MRSTDETTKMGGGIWAFARLRELDHNSHQLLRQLLLIVATLVKKEILHRYHMTNVFVSFLWWQVQQNIISKMNWIRFHGPCQSAVLFHRLHLLSYMSGTFLDTSHPLPSKSRFSYRDDCNFLYTLTSFSYPRKGLTFTWQEPDPLGHCWLDQRWTPDAR